MISTDGSALDNPGPPGAGIYYTSPRNRIDRKDLRLAISLGHGDNNWGEMVAIYVALRLIYMYFESGDGTKDHRTPCLIFSDSMCCVAYLTHTWPAPTDKELSWATRAIYQKIVKERLGDLSQSSLLHRP